MIDVLSLYNIPQPHTDRQGGRVATNGKMYT